MSDLELIVGHVYAGKRRQKVFLGDEYDDRVIVFIGGDQIQYDSYAVRNGRHYPKTTREKFLKWAKTDVTYQDKSERLLRILTRPLTDSNWYELRNFVKIAMPMKDKLPSQIGDLLITVDNAIAWYKGEMPGDLTWNSIVTRATALKEQI